MSFLKPLLKLDNYFCDASFVATIMFLAAAFQFPIIVLLIYVGIVFIYTTNVMDEDKEYELTLEFKRKDGSIGQSNITVTPSSEPVEKYYAFELLFHTQDSIIVKGTDAKNAIENARLTKEQLADFAGAEPL